MSLLGFGGHLAQLCNGSGQIAPRRLRHPEVKATCTRVEPVADCVGEVTSLLASCAHPEQVTRDLGALRLQGEDLAQPPPIVHGAGQADRLGEVCPGHLGVIARASNEAAGGQCPGQQGRVIDVSRDRQGLFGLIRTRGGAGPRIKHRLVGERPGAHRGRHLGVLRVEIGQRGVEPGPPFPDAAACLPERLQRRGQRQCQLDIGVFAAPREGGAQVVDLDIGLLEAVLIVIAGRRVEHGCHRRVVVAVAGPHRVGFAGFAELFQARIGALSPAAGSAFGPCCLRPPPAICRPAG